MARRSIEALVLLLAAIALVSCAGARFNQAAKPWQPNGPHVRVHHPSLPLSLEMPSGYGRECVYLAQADGAKGQFGVRDPKVIRYWFRQVANLDGPIAAVDVTLFELRASDPGVPEACLEELDEKLASWAGAAGVFRCALYDIPNLRLEDRGPVSIDGHSGRAIGFWLETNVQAPQYETTDYVVTRADQSILVVRTAVDPKASADERSVLAPRIAQSIRFEAGSGKDDLRGHCHEEPGAR